MHLLKSLFRGVNEYFRDECFYLAASVSYFSILALVPLSLLIVSFFGYLIGEDEALYQFILSGLVNLFPAVTKGITQELKNVIDYRGISMFMLFMYGFLSFSFFYSLERSMNVIFNVPQKRHFLASIFWSIFVVTLVIIFLLLSFTVSSMAGIFRDYPLNILGLEIGYKAGIFLRYIGPFLLVLMSFTAVYVVIPRVKVSWRNGLAGALFVTIMWELSKYFFTWYVKNVIHFGTIYGSLTTFILFLIWVYYSSSIFLLGAEFVKSLERRE